MRVLHTSDWHLGRSLYGRKRYEEFEQFLTWCGDTIEERQIELLIIAGDIFDTCTPSNRAQELYYRFLCRVANSACRDIVIVAGNHDSPSFLSAPGQLLKALNVHVVGLLPDDPHEAVLPIKADDNTLKAIVCAVPYLRDRDIRSSAAGETIEEKNRKLAQGIASHYRELVDEALKMRGDHDVPLIATGHLFAAGGKTVEGDGVRELYVGSLAHVHSSLFPEEIDYLALGHLHVPQKIGSETMRYSGSPIPMGFGEAHQQKLLLQLDFTGKNPAISEIEVPMFQKLTRLKGDLELILSEISALREGDASDWLEIEYTGDEVIGDLREQIEDAVVGSKLEIRRIKSRLISNRIEASQSDETLEDLTEEDVFLRKIAVSEAATEQQEELLATYRELLTTIHEADSVAE